MPEAKKPKGLWIAPDGVDPDDWVHIHVGKLTLMQEQMYKELVKEDET